MTEMVTMVESGTQHPGEFRGEIKLAGHREDPVSIPITETIGHDIPDSPVEGIDYYYYYSA
jgi:hypothetical protein